MTQTDMIQLLRDASIAESEAEAKSCRDQFVEAFRGLDHWTQCVLADLYDEVLRRSPRDLPDQLIFYMYLKSASGTTEHGLGRLEPATVMMR